MKKLAKKITILFMVLGMSTVMAQKGTEKQKLTPEQKSEKIAQKMTEELGLNEQQKVSVKALALEHIKEKQALREEMKVLKNKMKASRAAHQSKLKAILTTEQAEKLEQLMAEKKNKKGTGKKKCSEECKHK